MLSVVGVGPGNPAYLTPIALDRIQKAEILIGGRRHLQLFTHLPVEKILWDKANDIRIPLDSSKRVVILASGDPLIFGILDFFLSRYPSEDIEVIPGISTVQYILAKLRLPAKDLAVVSLHGRTVDIVSVVKKHTLVVVFTDFTHTPQQIAQVLLSHGVTIWRIYVGENLSYPEEQIRCFTLEELTNSVHSFDLNTVVIQRCGNLEQESLTLFS
ncbi:MAG: precorrin-6y C5,15-methyltransferase (decarboxylating) subunit CbiE [Candidatus Caldatribacteriaceae bacterium]